MTQLTHTEQVKRLIKGGAQLIQLREKHLAQRDFFEDALEAVKFARAKNVKIIINDRVDIAIALNADGVHLGQDDFPPIAAREILGEKAIIGFSTHNLPQISEAMKLPIDYVAIGPIFDTQTKENPDETLGLEIIERARRLIGNFPLVAIGGVNRNNFSDVLKAGADSVAIISDLLKFPDEITETVSILLGVKEN